MKTSQPAAVAAAMIVASLCIPMTAHSAPATSPSVPVGWLSVNSTVVRAGTCPTLQWNIDYPSTVVDYVDVDTGTVTPKQELEMKVRVLGAGVTSSHADGSNLKFVPTEARVSVAGDSYEQIFYGTNHDVNQNKVVYSATVQPGESICFGGRYYFNWSWSYFYNSNSGTMNVRTLVNGDVPPTVYPLHTAPSLESFIKPYLDASGRVKIGPMDVIVFMELTHKDSQMSDGGYDLQDMVLLVTFEAKKKKNNNGHGNNADGVDSSNPGNAPFVDSDPSVDDESGKKKKK